MQNHKEWVKDTFERAAPTYGQKSSAFFDYFGMRLVELSGVQLGDQVLDVATGRGAVLFPASKLVGNKGRVLGIDISSQMIELTKKEVQLRELSNVDLQKMDAENLSLPSEAFDCVLCGFAIFFFPSLSKALQQFRRVLKPNGKIALSTWASKPSLTSWAVNECKKLSKNNTSLTGTLIRDKEHLSLFLKEARFNHIEIIEGKKEFSYPNAEAWWESLWAHGTRASLEKLTNEQLTKFKKRALDKAEQNIKNSRVTEEFHAFYALAHKMDSNA